jgi:hypothetical protein
MLSISEERDLTRREEQQFVDLVRQEAVDRPWAARAQAGLQKTLAEIASKNGFRLESTDCRTTRCVALVSFASYEVAKANYSQIAHASYDPNCAVAISIPDTDPGPGEVRANVRFDCETSRVREAAGR